MYYIITQKPKSRAGPHWTAWQMRLLLPARAHNYNTKKWTRRIRLDGRLRPGTEQPALHHTGYLGRFWVFIPGLPNFTRMVEPSHQKASSQCIKASCRCFWKVGFTIKTSQLPHQIWLSIPFYKCNSKNQNPNILFSHQSITHSRKTDEWIFAKLR